MADPFAAISSLKNLSDMLSAALDARDANARNALAIALQKEIITAQQQAVAVIDENNKLKEKCVQLENWAAEKAAHSLHALPSGHRVYLHNDDVESSEDAHQYCANCFAKGEKSILQPNSYTPGRASVLECHSCHSVLYLAGHPEKGHPNFR
jgi:RecJ-like exonuclease